MHFGIKFGNNYSGNFHKCPLIINELRREQ